MNFFPGMRLPATKKRSLVEHTIRTLQQHWSVRPMDAVTTTHAVSSAAMALTPRTA
jgi:hypothetical protein